MKSTLLAIALVFFLAPAACQGQNASASATTSSTAAPPQLLLEDLNLEIDRRIAVARTQQGQTLNLFASEDDTSFTYKRTPSCWVHDLDLTGVVVSHDYLCQGNHLTSGGALITPQDVICPAHFAIPNGATLNFVDANNVVHTGKVQKGGSVPGTDIYLCHLAAPVTGVKAYKVLPADYASYTPYYNLTRWPVLLAYNFGHRAFILDCQYLNAELGYRSCTEALRVPYTLKISSGSGSPAFAVINGEPVLVGCLHTTNSTSWIAGHEPGINELLTTLGSTYTLTTYDLKNPVPYAQF